VSQRLIPIADPDAIGLGVGRRTLGRRIKNPPPGFPKAVRINNRVYLVEAQLEAYKAKLIQGVLPVEKPEAESARVEAP
jgi:hypothetical protein